MHSNETKIPIFRETLKVLLVIYKNAFCFTALDENFEKKFSFKINTMQNDFECDMCMTMISV